MERYHLSYIGFSQGSLPNALFIGELLSLLARGGGGGDGVWEV